MMEERGGAAAATPTTTTGDEVAHTGASNIKVQVSYGSNNFDVFVLPQSTFGDLKRVIAKATGLEPEAQNLLFRGKEKDENERLDMAGVKDNAKVIVTENSPTKDKDEEEEEEEEEALEKVEEEVKEISKGVEAVSLVRKENDEFAEQVGSLEAVVCSGTQVSDKDFLFLTEMLMRQLLKLDGIDAQGEGRIQRKLEVRRVQGLVETLDDLKVKNSNPNPNPSSNVPEPEASATKATQEWEVFE